MSGQPNSHVRLYSWGPETQRVQIWDLAGHLGTTELLVAQSVKLAAFTCSAPGPLLLAAFKASPCCRYSFRRSGGSEHLGYSCSPVLPAVICKTWCGGFLPASSAFAAGGALRLPARAAATSRSLCCLCCRHKAVKCQQCPRHSGPRPKQSPRRQPCSLQQHPQGECPTAPG